MVAMETITAFIDGPLCFLTVAAFVTEKIRPCGYIFQLLVSLCQLYGCTLFYFTEIVDGFKHTELWDPVNFWFYFVILNVPWIVIPLICIYNAAYNLSLSQRKYDSAVKKRK